MDDFPGILARDFGFRPQGKSAPMAASKVGVSGGVGTFDLESGSTRSYGATSSWDKSRSNWSSEGVGIPESRSTPAYDDVFGGGGSAGYSNPTTSSHGHAESSPAPPDLDSIFDGFKESGPKMTSSSSMPVYDKPVYDDDIFEGVPGLRSSFSSSSAKYDDVFSSIASGSNRAPTPPAYDDLFENLGKPAQDRKGTDDRSGVGKGHDAFDELIPGFGGSSSPPRKNESPRVYQKKTSFSSSNASANVAEDPFSVLESASTSSYSPSVFSDPLGHIGRPENSGSTKVDASSANGNIFNDVDLLNGVKRSVPSFANETNKNQRDNTSSHDVQKTIPGNRSPVKESNQPPTDAFENILPNMQYSKPSDSQKSVQRNSHGSNTYEYNDMADQSPKFHNNTEVADDIWLTVSEIPLFTQPTSAPPPSRAPPPLVIKQSSFGAASKRNENEDFRQSTQSHPYSRGLGKKPVASPIDELEDFASGRSQNYAYDRGDTYVTEEVSETTSAAASAAAMKEAMDRAEAKFKHAKEVRERERDAKVSKNRESVHVEREEETKVDVEDSERHEILDREEELKAQEEREKEKEKEKEQKRLERERALEIERQRAREAVERATREARERAAADARLRAERAAVEKVAAEARQRAERAAVQRASAEARERAAAEARQKAEKEAVQRAAVEAREKAVRAERTAVERAAAEARLRAERAAVERAATVAREKQQKAEDDLESFFGVRANSAPKQRPAESFFDNQPQNNMAADEVRRTTSGSSSNIKKASSTTNIVDDLTSIFGGPSSSSSGEFQEIEGESEERRIARLERHQRTIERANKALAEKKERDLHNQMEQQERHRISETLDFEIKRWAAGKEGNLRALLSTLQYVLWPECGWQPVSLTDLIIAAAVKKVYRKATLCIHPDKVQQKGATLQQKYIAEKVFDLLKEAWNKFNSEELF